jgi:hypothetical protein
MADARNVAIQPDKFKTNVYIVLNPLNAELNPICQLLALLGAHPIFHVSRIRVKSHLPIAGIIRGSPYIPR